VQFLEHLECEFALLHRLTHPTSQIALLGRFIKLFAPRLRLGDLLLKEVNLLSPRFPQRGTVLPREERQLVRTLLLAVGVISVFLLR
jgi:hypothetical protein